MIRSESYKERTAREQAKRQDVNGYATAVERTAVAGSASSGRVVGAEKEERW